MENHFTEDERRCPCCGLDKTGENPDFMRALNSAREIYGKPMDATSMTRCAKHNTEIGGAKRSAHLLGRAIDIQCNDPHERAAMHDALFMAGFRRFEFSAVHVHADMKPDAESMILIKDGGRLV